MDMEYNSQRENLIIPEYGRNLQKMVDYAVTIEDPEQRQLFAEMVVDLMQQMQPQGRNVNREFKEKLWNHILMISKYKLDVKPPENIEIVTPEQKKQQPRLPYPAEEKRYRHYGHNIKVLLEKAINVEDPEKQQMLLNVIGSYMKIAYKTWNKEHYVNDEMIINDLKAMAEGKVEVPDNLAMDFLQGNNKRKRPPVQSHRDKRKYKRK